MLAAFIKHLPPGFVFLVTATGKSMEPTMRSGDVVQVKRARIETVRLGTVVALIQPRSSFLVLHRAVGRVVNGRSVKLQTKGDANSMLDPWRVDKNNFLGKAVWIMRGKRRVKLTSYQQSRFQILADKLIDIPRTFLAWFVVERG